MSISQELPVFWLILECVYLKILNCNASSLKMNVG
jgi:hypothetical protein